MINLNKSSQIQLQQNSRTQKENSSHVQLYCAFHKDKTITNFCVNLQCLLPMCPSCVSIHNQQHKQENTHGQFLSIHEVIENTSNLLTKSNKTLEQLSQQYTQDYWNKQKILQACKQMLSNQKKKLIKQIQRRFEQIQYKMTRKINSFQDNIHDQYKLLQSQIQYLYDSLNKQKQQFSLPNDKILKNIIFFYSHKKQDKIKDWLKKFRQNVDQLKKQSIRIKCNEDMFDLVKSLDYYFTIEQFNDQQNQYLISTGRQLISSNTKRKGIQSPRWNQNKQNLSDTLRQNHSQNRQNANTIRQHFDDNYEHHVQTPIIFSQNVASSALNKSNIMNTFDFKNNQQWSASKY